MWNIFVFPGPIWQIVWLQIFPRYLPNSALAAATANICKIRQNMRNPEIHQILAFWQNPRNHQFPYCFLLEDPKTRRYLGIGPLAQIPKSTWLRGQPWTSNLVRSGNLLWPPCARLRILGPISSNLSFFNIFLSFKRVVTKRPSSGHLVTRYWRLGCLGTQIGKGVFRTLFPNASLPAAHLQALDMFKCSRSSCTSSEV